MDGMNLPLLRRFAAEGVLPTFSALMARGATNRVLPAIPAWTPTNWATMITGATAGTHGLGGWSVRQKSDSWTEHRLHSWHSDSMTAETIWEVADEAGKRVLVNFWPSGSWPSRLRHGYVVASGFHDSQFPIAAPVEFFCTTRADVAEGRRAGARGLERARQGGRSGQTIDTAETGISPGSIVCRLAPAVETGWRDAPEGALAATLLFPRLRSGESALHLLATRRGDGGFERVVVCEAKDPATALVTLERGRWSDFAIRSWGDGAGVDGNTEGSVRFHLLAADAAAGTLRVVASQVYAARGFASPAGLDRQLLEAAGPFFDTFSINPTGGEAERDCFLGDIRYQGEWQVRVARHVMQNGGWDLHFSHWHLFDHINHPTVNPADPDGPDYDPVTGEWMRPAADLPGRRRGAAAVPRAGRRRNAGLRPLRPRHAAGPSLRPPAGAPGGGGPAGAGPRRRHRLRAVEGVRPPRSRLRGLRLAARAGAVRHRAARRLRRGERRRARCAAGLA
jgi:hypothetical protein